MPGRRSVFVPDACGPAPLTATVSLQPATESTDKMDTSRIRSLIVEKVKARPAMMKRARKYAKDAPEPVNAQDLAGLEPWLANNDLHQYLTECLVPGGYIASGLAVHDLREIRESTVQGCSPGGDLLPLGYLVIANSAGGNEVCVGTDGHVYWADHEAEYTPESVLQELVHLSENFESFLVSLLTDQLDQQLRALN